MMIQRPSHLKWAKVASAWFKVTQVLSNNKSRTSHRSISARRSPEHGIIVPSSFLLRADEVIE
jgi:hypothetical protein